jgi:hypothetical protein
MRRRNNGRECIFKSSDNKVASVRALALALGMLFVGASIPIHNNDRNLTIFFVLYTGILTIEFAVIISKSFIQYKKYLTLVDKSEAGGNDSDVLKL